MKLTYWLRDGKILLKVGRWKREEDRIDAVCGSESFRVGELESKIRVGALGCGMRGARYGMLDRDWRDLEN